LCPLGVGEQLIQQVPVSRVVPQMVIQIRRRAPGFPRPSAHPTKQMRSVMANQNQ
jgi:hypothetical protein